MLLLLLNYFYNFCLFDQNKHNTLQRRKYKKMNTAVNPKSKKNKYMQITVNRTYDEFNMKNQK